MTNQKVIVYIHHDRHIDDNIEVYPYSAENWAQAKEKCRRDWGYNDPKYPGLCQCDSPTYYKYSWDRSGSYESSVQIVDQLLEPVVPKAKT